MTLCEWKYVWFECVLGLFRSTHLVGVRVRTALYRKSNAPHPGSSVNWNLVANRFYFIFNFCNLIAVLTKYRYFFKNNSNASLFVNSNKKSCGKPIFDTRQTHSVHKGTLNGLPSQSPSLGSTCDYGRRAAIHLATQWSLSISRRWSK